MYGLSSAYYLRLGVNDSRVPATKLDLAARWAVVDLREASVGIRLATGAAMADGLDRGECVRCLFSAARIAAISS